MYTTVIMPNEKQCRFCGDYIEIHHNKLHQACCYLNPINLKKISDYITTNLVTPKLLSRARFNTWAKSQNILTSITITSRMAVSNWTEALYQLAIYCYLADYMSFEYVECLLYTLTDGTMWLDQSVYQSIIKSIRQTELQRLNISSHHLQLNYCQLLSAIIDRAKRDMTYNHGERDENSEIVDVVDAVSFLQSFAPSVLQHQIELNMLSDDALAIATNSTEYNQKTNETDR